MARQTKKAAAATAEKDPRGKALDTAISQIEKKYGAGTIMRLGEGNSLEVSAVSTGSLTLDLALGVGGLPRGRIIEIYGPESSGKTTVALHAVAEVQKQGGVAAFVDAEHALDPNYAKALGVNKSSAPISWATGSSSWTSTTWRARSWAPPTPAWTAISTPAS